MLTVHYAGSLVKHPDTARAYKRRQEYYAEKGKCKHGVTVWQCSDAMKEAKRITREGKKIDTDTCQLGSCGMCPAYRSQVENGKKEKKFRITNRHYTEIADRVAYMKDNAKHKLLFLTLTLPKFKKDVKLNTIDNEINKAFSRFVENLTEHYGLTAYLAVKEGDGVNKRYHFHLIAVLPFHSFIKLNNAWLSAISNLCEPSPNALTTDRNARFIRSTASAVRYICKYISKSRGIASKTRIIFCDRETAQAAVRVQTDHSKEELTEGFKSVRAFEMNDYVIKYTIADRKEFDRFFKTVIKPLFNSAGRNTAELYCFPEESTQ